MNRCLRVMIVGQFAALQLAAQETDAQLEIAHTLRHASSITAIAVSPDGKTLAAAGYDVPYRVWKVRLWDVADGKAKATFVGHEGRRDTIRALRFSPDGAILASASGDNTIRLWDVAAGKEQATLTGTSETRTLTFCPDGRTLASASHDKTITLWDVRSGKGRIVETGHRTWVREILFSPDGRTLASNGYYDLKIWDAAGKEIGAIKGRVSAMSFSPDGKTLTSAIGHRITQWTVSGGQEPTIVEGQEYASYDRFRAILSPNGETLATIDQDLMGVNLGRGLAPAGEKRCRLILMDVESGAERTIVETRGLENWFGPVWYSPDGKALALWNWEDESITLVDAASGEQQAILTAPDGEKRRPGRVPPLAFALDGKILATTHGSSITLWVVP